MSSVAVALLKWSRMTTRSGRSALAHRFQKLGLQYTRNDIDVLYEQFLKVADQKKEVKEEDLMQLAEQYKSEASMA